MISFDDAKRIALQRIGPDCGLIEESMLERPFGWYFMYQSLRWLRTRKVRDKLIGSGGFVVDREDGRGLRVRGTSLEHNLAAYEYGLRHEAYELTVTAVRDHGRAVGLLSRLGLTYLKPGWKALTLPYDEHQIADRLRSPPCTFEAGRRLSWQLDVLRELDQTGCCVYELRGQRVERRSER